MLAEPQQLWETSTTDFKELNSDESGAGEPRRVVSLRETDSVTTHDQEEE